MTTRRRTPTESTDPERLRPGATSTDPGPGPSHPVRRGVTALVVASVVALLLVLRPVPGRAQLVCAGPHATPTLPASGYRATEAPGTGWVELTVFHQSVREQFGPGGERGPLLAGARALATSVFATATIGLVEGVDATVQLPIHRLRIDGVATPRERTGPGDVRVHARVDAARFGLDRVPVALRAGVKLPGSSFPVDPTVLPLTEGQRDWELMLQFGRSLDWRPVYLVGWLGRRWRDADVEREYDPGDETVAYLAVGGRLSGWSWEFAADGVWGAPPRHQGLRLETGRRRILQLFPRVGRGVGPGELRIGGQLPLTGRNLPADPAVTIGYLLEWGRGAPEDDEPPGPFRRPGPGPRS